MDERAWQHKTYELECRWNLKIFTPFSRLNRPVSQPLAPSSDITCNLKLGT
jgi:hypothetical protein